MGLGGLLPGHPHRLLDGGGAHQHEGPGALAQGSEDGACRRALGGQALVPLFLRPDGVGRALDKGLDLLDNFGATIMHNPMGYTRKMKRIKSIS